MDSKTNGLCKIFTILLLSIYYRPAAATNIDCNGKPFHCVNATHFMICVDFGAGISQTVDDFVIRCPPTTVCRGNNHFECEYQLPATTSPANEINVVTNKTEMNTISSNDILSTVNPIENTSMKKLFDEYDNVADVTKTSNDAQNMQNEISGISNDLTNFNLTTQPSLIENLFSNIPEKKFRNTSEPLILLVRPKDKYLFQRNSHLSFSTNPEEVTSEQSFTTNDNNIMNTPNNETINNTDGDFHFTKSMDTLFNGTIKIARKDPSTFDEQDVKTFKELDIQDTHTENNSVTKSLPFFSDTTETTFLKLFSTDQYTNDYENILPKIETIKPASKSDKVSQSIMDKNISKTSLLTETDNTNIYDTLAKSDKITKIPPSPTYPPTTEVKRVKEMDTISLYEYSISNITEEHNFTNEFSTLEPTLTPTEEVIETKQTKIPTTPSSNNFDDYVTFPEVALGQTVPVLTTPEYQFDIINVTSSDYKLPSEILTTSEATPSRTKLLQILKEDAIYVNDINTMSSNNDLLHVMSTKTQDNFDFNQTISSIEYKVTTPLNLLEQKFQDIEMNTYRSFMQTMPEVEEKMLKEISSTHANIPILQINEIYNVTNDDLPTPYSLSTSNSKNKSIYLQYEHTRETFPGTEALSLENYISGTANNSTLDINMTYAYDNNEIVVTTPILNINDQSTEMIVTESTNSFTYVTKNYKLPTQNENMTNRTSLIITENPYFYGTSLNADNSSESKFNLNNEQMTTNAKGNASTPYAQYMSHTTFSRDIPAVNASITKATEIFLTSHGFTTLSALLTFKQTAMEQAKQEKELLISTTMPYYNENETFTQYDNASDRVLEITANSTASENYASNIDESWKNDTAFVYNNSTGQSDIQHILKKSNKNLDGFTQFLKSFNFIESNDTIDDIITTPKYSSVNKISVVPNTNDNVSITMEPELITVTASNDIQTTDILLTGEQPFGNEQNTDTTLLRDKKLQDAGITWLEAILTSTVNPTTPKRITLDVDLVTVDSIPDYVDPYQTTTQMTKSYNKDTKHVEMPLNMPNEAILPSGVENLVREYSRTKYDDAINETYYKENIFNDTTYFILNYHTKQTTEPSLLKGQYVLNTEELVTNDKITASTPKILMRTEVSKIGDIIPTHDQMTTKVLVKESFSPLTSENPNEIGKNTENKKFESILFLAQKNKDTKKSGYVNNSALTNSTVALKQQPEIKLIRTDANHNTFTILNSTLPSNTTTTNLFVNSEVLDSSSKKSLSASDNVETSTKEIEIPITANSLVEQTLTTINGSLVVNNFSSTNNIVKVTVPVNITHNFRKHKSDAQSINLPFHYPFKNYSINRNNAINHSDTVTMSPMSGSNIVLHKIIRNNNTLNNLTMKNNEENYEDRTSNKRSVFINTETPRYNTPFAVMKNNKLELQSDSEVNLETSTRNAIKTTTYSEIVIRESDDLYVGKKTANNIFDENNSTRTAEIITHSNITKTQIKYMGSVTPKHYKPPLPLLLENMKQAPSYKKNNQTLQNREFVLKTKQDNSNKTMSFDHTRGDKNVQVPETHQVNYANKKNLTINRLVRTDTGKSRNSSNINMKVKQNSMNTTLFRCSNRSRGRFADTSNCSKFYICIGRRRLVSGECPSHTVFSEFKKQCTKNLAHCVRNNQFRCIQEGRFSDVLRRNIYYICVNYNNTYLRFQFQCQNGFHLNKKSVKCVSDIKYQSIITSTSVDSDSTRGSDQSTVEHKTKDKQQAKQDEKFICKEEGKFPDIEDCRKYYECTKNSKSEFRRRTKKCDSDEVFHRKKKKCVESDSYDCS